MTEGRSYKPGVIDRIKSAMYEFIGYVKITGLSLLDIKYNIDLYEVSNNKKCAFLIE
jgi:hypothetical protein